MYIVAPEELTERSDQNYEDLLELAEQLIDEKSPSASATIFTKYHPATRLDPPEWEDTETTLDYENIPESAIENLKENVRDELWDNTEHGEYPSKENWFNLLKPCMTEKKWDDILYAWTQRWQNELDEAAQELFNDRREYTYACTYDCY